MQIDSVCQLLAELKLDPEEAIVAQGKTFLESAFVRFAPIGLFSNLFRRDPLSDSFWDALYHVVRDNAKQDSLRASAARSASGRTVEPLRELIVKDTLKRMFERDRATASVIAQNLNIYVEKVFQQGWSEKFAEGESAQPFSLPKIVGSCQWWLIRVRSEL